MSSHDRPDYTRATFAAAVGCTVRTVDNLLARGDIRAYRVGPRMVRIPASELDRLRAGWEEHRPTVPAGDAA